MSNTAKVHLRFWLAMTERYGRRWTEQYGTDPSPAWRELVDKYTPDDVKLALAELPKEAPDFPPTMPQFQAILAKAAQKRKDDPTDYLRGYWRAAIVNEVATKLGYTFETLEPVIVANRATLGKAMRDLLDALCDSERRTGQKTEGMHVWCERACQEIADGCWQLRNAA